MTWYRLPLFVWSLYATSVILVLATPVLAITLLLIALERLFHVGVFDPGAGRRSAAVPASVLVLLAPRRLHHDPAGLGRRQRDHSAASRARQLFGYKFVAWASVAIAVIGFFVWGHHMFVAGHIGLLRAWSSRC